MAMGEPLASTACTGLAARAVQTLGCGKCPCVRTRDAKPLRASLEAQAAIDHGFSADRLDHGCRGIRAGGSSRFSKNLWAAEPSRTFIRACSMPAATPETLPEYPCMGEATPFMFWDSRMVPSSLGGGRCGNEGGVEQGQPGRIRPGNGNVVHG